MTAEDRQRVKDTLAAALALPVRERPGFIDSATAGAPHVRREVSLLVSLSEDAGEFLEQPAIGIPPNADPLPGDLIGGRYQLEETLGHGGSASVFKARDTLLGGKPVAVKILRHGVFDDAALRNEIAALARIDHPGIASVTDAGTLPSGRLYLVTRYIAGPTLAERLEESKLSPKQAGRLGRRLAAALAAAHEAGVLHLDLRPDNIILERSGTPEENPVILDFGIAKRSGQSYPFASLGATPYHAPELAQGSQTAAADVFALGVLLREMVDPPIPHSWRRLIAALTDPDPGRRPPAAAIPPRIPKPGLTPVFAAAAFAAVALFWAFHPGSSNPAVTISIPQPITAIPGEEEAPAFCGDTLYFTWQPPSGGEANIWKLGPGQSNPVRVTNSGLREAALACSADGTRLAFLRDLGVGKNAIVLLPLDGGPEQRLAEGRYDGLAWSPDGRSVIAAEFRFNPGMLVIGRFDLATSQWTDLTHPSPGMKDLSPQLSPSGRQMVFVREEGGAGARLMVQSGNQARRVGPAMINIVSPVWLDEKRVVFAGGSPTDRRLWVVDTTSDAHPMAIDAAGLGIDRVAYLASSRRLVISRSRSDDNIHRLTLSPSGDQVLGQEPIITSSRTDEEPAVSPDGRYLAFASSRGGEQQIWRTDLDGSHPVQLTNLPPNMDLQPFWSPDSQWVGYGFRTIAGAETRMVHRDDPSRERLLPGAGRGVLWSAAGDAIYHFAATPQAVEGPLSRYDLATGASQVLAPDVRGRLFQSPDGKTLFFAPFRERVGIWTLPSGGGPMTPVVTETVTRRVFAAGSRGLYYVRGVGKKSGLFYRPYSSGEARLIYEFPRRVNFGMSVTPDGKYLYFTEREGEFADLHAATVTLPR